MAKYNYSIKGYDKERMARAVGTNLNISTKHCVEICATLRKKALNKAKAVLKDVIEKRQAVPFKKFKGDVGHKKGIGPGRFPLKASAEILKLLRSVGTNAQQKGLNTANLIISHISAQRAARQWRYGRLRGRTMKRTHVELVVEEQLKKKEKKPALPEEKKETAAPKEKVKATPKKETPKEKKPETKKEEKPEKKEKAVETPKIEEKEKPTKK